MKYFVSIFKEKKLIEFFAIILLACIWVSCSDDNAFQQPAFLSSTIIERGVCGIHIDNLERPVTGDFRTFYVNNELNKREIIWGVGDSVGLGIPFVKPENLMDYGVRIISNSSTEDSIKIEFLNAYKGGYVGYKLFVEKDTTCIAGIGWERVK